MGCGGGVKTTEEGLKTLGPLLPGSGYVEATISANEGHYWAATGTLAMEASGGKYAKKFVGLAQQTFRAGRVATGHAMRSLREGYAMLRSGNYEKVALNRQLSTITDGKIDSQLRPDVAGVRPDGKVDITEVLSPGQKPEELRAKYAEALGDRMGDFKAVEPTKQLCTGSRIMRESC